MKRKGLPEDVKPSMVASILDFTPSGVVGVGVLVAEVCKRITMGRLSQHNRPRGVDATNSKSRTPAKAPLQRSPGAAAGKSPATLRESPATDQATGPTIDCAFDGPLEWNGGGCWEHPSVLDRMHECPEPILMPHVRSRFDLSRVDYHSKLHRPFHVEALSTLAVTSYSQRVLGIVQQRVAPVDSRDAAAAHLNWPYDVVPASDSALAHASGRVWVDVLHGGRSWDAMVRASHHTKRHYIMRVCLTANIQMQSCDFEQAEPIAAYLERQPTLAAVRPRFTAFTPGSEDLDRYELLWTRATFARELNLSKSADDAGVSVLLVRPVKTNGVRQRPWFLITNLDISCAEEAEHIVAAYQTHQLAATYHRVWRLGLLATRDQWPLEGPSNDHVTLASLTAIMLVNLHRRDAGSVSGKPAYHFVDPHYVQALAAWGRRPPELTLHEFLLTLSKLGGGQTAHGAGWYYLWRGWELLRILADGPQDTIRLAEAPEVIHCKYDLAATPHPLRERLCS